MNFAGIYFEIESFDMSVKQGSIKAPLFHCLYFQGYFSPILVFLFLNEVMNLSQYIGMGFLIECAIVLSFSNAEIS